MYSLLGQCLYAKILNSKSVIEILGVILLFKFCIVLFEISLGKIIHRSFSLASLYWGSRPSIYSHLGRSHTVPPIGAWNITVYMTPAQAAAKETNLI